MANHYDIWTDGSTADGAGASMGAGWVIRDEAGTELEYASPLLTPRHGSSEIAEIMAVSTALRTISAGAEITVHTDSLSVIRIFGKGVPKETPNLSNGRRKKLEAVQELFAAAAIHNIRFEKAVEEADPLLKRAHHRAREASTIASGYMHGRKEPPFSIYAAPPGP